MRRALPVLALLFAVTACGGGSRLAHLTLTLDWTPNPDHVGFYYAREAGIFRGKGLSVSIHAPSDPTAPLKLVGAGKTDLAVSYEQEVFFAAAKKLPVVAVASVVGQPLNSIMAIDPRIRSLGDLKGRSIGITGVPADYAALASAGLSWRDLKIVNVGYNLLPALLSHRVDAVLGVYRNVEGVELRLRGFHPRVFPLDRVGVPHYDELVLVANSDRLRSDSGYRGRVARFVDAFLAGTQAAQSHPRRSLEILRKVTASSKRFLARATPATLELLSDRTGLGCMLSAGWDAFGTWMLAHKLLKKPVPVSSVMTTRFLPSRCPL